MACGRVGRWVVRVGGRAPDEAGWRLGMPFASCLAPAASGVYSSLRPQQQISTICTATHTLSTIRPTAHTHP